METINNLYYQAPTQRVFDEVQREAIKIWNTYSDEYGYRSEKVARVEDLHNVSDNVMYIVAMFDHMNQRKLAQNLSHEARDAIRERYIAGGGQVEHTPF